MYDYQVHWRNYRSPNLTFPCTNEVEALFGGRAPCPGTDPVPFTTSQAYRRMHIEQIHYARLEKPLPHNRLFSLQYQRIDNGSNVVVYDFAQNIFMGVLTWMF